MNKKQLVTRALKKGFEVSGVQQLGQKVLFAKVAFVALSALVAISLPLVFGSYVIVKGGHVGVIDKLGAVQPIALHEGFHLKTPFIERIIQVDTRLTKTTSVAEASSKDLQNVRTQVTIQYSMTSAGAPKSIQTVGTRDALASTVIEPAIQESVKEVTAQYTAAELVSMRSQVKLRIHEAIEKFIDVTLGKKDISNALRIANVAITDFDFSAEFNKAIELKVKAEQEALQAKNEKTRRVTQAEAGMLEQKLKADGAAYAIEVSSKARAEAIEREAAALKQNTELIQLRAVERWDGQVPLYSGSGEITPFLNVESLKRQS